MMAAVGKREELAQRGGGGGGAPWPADGAEEGETGGDVAAGPLGNLLQEFRGKIMRPARMGRHCVPRSC